LTLPDSEVSLPTRIDAFQGADEIAIGDQFTCLRWGPDRIECAGTNKWGQLGDGVDVGCDGLNQCERRTLAPVASLTGVAQLSAGNAHVCARLTDGTVRCWGVGGRLGDGTNVLRRVLTAVVGLSNVTHVAAGFDHTCALTSDGHAWCWGENTDGQLGDGTLTGRVMPTLVPELSDVMLLDAGTSSSCALTHAGALFCWGAGDPVDGGWVKRSSPTRVTLPN
jgi:alpha-tubulin suppressor-like RCC1 family protein